MYQIMVRSNINQELLNIALPEYLKDEVIDRMECNRSLDIVYERIEFAMKFFNGVPIKIDDTDEIAIYDEDMKLVNEMKKFEVQLKVTAYCVIDVYAYTEDQAAEKAEDEFCDSPQNWIPDADFDNVSVTGIYPA